MTPEWIAFRAAVKKLEDAKAEIYTQLYALKDTCLHEETTPMRNRYSTNNNIFETTFDQCVVCLRATNMKTVKTKRGSK